jgi:hypothetical protein
MPAKTKASTKKPKESSSEETSEPVSIRKITKSKPETVKKTTRKEPSPEPAKKKKTIAPSSDSEDTESEEVPVKGKTPSKGKVTPVSNKKKTPVPKESSQSEDTESEEEVVPVKGKTPPKKKITPVSNKKKTPVASPSSVEDSELEPKKKVTPSKSERESKRERSTSRAKVSMSSKEEKRATADMKNWDEGTAGIMEVFSRVDKVEGDKSIRNIQKNLSLDFSETPLTPVLLKKYFSNTKAEILGINILLTDEDTLDIPESIRSQLHRITVTNTPKKEGDIGKNAVTDIDVLGDCQNLQYLSLSGSASLVDLMPLGTLKNLEVVDLSYCTSLKSLLSVGKQRYCFRSSHNLHFLNLSHCSGLTTLVKIGTSSMLDYLNLSHCSSLTNIEEVARLPALTSLDIAHCPKMEAENSIAVLDRLNNLNYVNIHNSFTQDKESEVRIVLQDVSRLTIGNFNMLARGLEADFFLASGGEEVSVLWKNRGAKVTNVIVEMMRKCQVVVVEENDQFFPILNQLKERIGGHIEGIFCSKTTPPKKSGGDPEPTNARVFRLRLMLSSIDSSLLTEEENEMLAAVMKASPKDLKKMVPAMYDAVNRVNKSNNLFTTYKNEIHSLFAHDISTFYGRESDDVYVEDDGIGIYYNSEVLNPTEKIGKIMLEKIDTSTAGYGGMVGETHFFFNKDGWLDVEFDYRGKSVTIIGAHLTSGEGVKNEGERYVTAESITSALSSMDRPTIPFLIMDSNVSPEYEKAFPVGTKLATSLFTGLGFRDAVPPGEFPCFKERGPLSDQKDKRCELMFDQIDKMYYLPTTATIVPRESPLYEFGFLRFPPAIREEVYAIRNNPTLRAENKEYCLKIKTDKVEEMFPDLNSPFRYIYPGPNSPSDHPPIATTFILGNPIIVANSGIRSRAIVENIRRELTEYYTIQAKDEDVEPYTQIQLDDFFIANAAKIAQVENELMASPEYPILGNTYRSLLAEKGLYLKLK